MVIQSKLNCSIKDFIFDFKIINALDHLSDEQQVVEVEKKKEFYNCYVAKVDYGNNFAVCKYY